MGLTGEPVPHGSRSGAITHRNDQRRRCFAQGQQLFEVQVVQQVQAQRVDRQHVNRKADTFHGARGGVVVAIAAERRNPPFGEQLERRRVQASPGPGHVPGAQLIPAAAIADPDEQQIALADVDVLCRLSCGQVGT